MLKATHEILQFATEQSFLLRKFGAEAFKAPYHFHQEYELTLIPSGSGKRYVGSHMADFNAGDIVIVGANLPHCWKLVPEKQPDAQAVVIQFTADFLGSSFFEKPELTLIRELLDRSSSGICFAQTDYERTFSAIAAMQHQDSFQKLITFIEILQGLAASAHMTLLDKQPGPAVQDLSDQKRINPVLAYLVENFRKEVSLTAAASLTNMTTNAFCKYFKRVTRKTFMEMVIQYRLNYATQQLVQTDNPVTDIAFESGFSDVSHFYKTFKAKMGLSPLNYRKKFMGEV